MTAVGSSGGDDGLIGSITLLAEKRIEQHIAEQTTKHAKYKNLHAMAKLNAELELEKEKIKQHECLKLEVVKLKQQEHLLEMQHQRKHEKEAHELWMMEMQFSLCRPGNFTEEMSNLTRTTSLMLPAPSLPSMMPGMNMDLSNEFGLGHSYQM